MDSEPAMTEELLPIPELLNCKCSYTFDYGGSVIKVLYRKRNEKGEEVLLMTSLSAGEHDQLFQLLSSIAKPQTEEVIVTGVGSKTHAHTLQEKLGVKLKIANEFECFIKGFRELSGNVSYDVMFTEVPRQSILTAAEQCRGFAKMMASLSAREDTEVTMSSDDTSAFSADLLQLTDDQIVSGYRQNNPDVTELFPCLIVMCSSGFAAYKMTKSDGVGELGGYSPCGGRTLLGLGSLLTGAQSYDELLTLAEKGDNSKVDAYIRSLKTGNDGTDDFYGSFPSDALVFCFSHAYKKSIGDFKREDLASAVVQLASINAAEFGVQLAQIHRIKNVVFCGSFINHHTVIEKLSQSFLEQSLFMPEAVQPKLHICKMGTYLGAIGAWVMGKDAETKTREAQP